jgi:AbrB family looped-hinge helix DNA binding protein
MLRKVGQSFQIALPKEIVRFLGLKVNDYIDVNVEGHKIVLEPKLIIPKDQAYFFTPEWQAGEREAEEDIRAGRVTKTKNLKGLFKKLDS